MAKPKPVLRRSIYTLLGDVAPPFYFDIFNILIAPLKTKINTNNPTTKSGIFEFRNKTKTPAIITPILAITSFDVNI